MICLILIGVQFLDGTWIKTVPESGGACLDGSEASSRGQQSEEVVAGVGRVLYYTSGPSDASGAVDVSK